MSGRLPDWLAQRLGVPPSPSGEAASWQLQYVWSYAPWVTLLAVLLIGGFVIYNYLRESASVGRGLRGLLMALRLLALTLLGLILAEFLLVIQRTGLPTLTILVDNSASMGITDRYEDSATKQHVASLTADAGKTLKTVTRLDLAKQILTGNDDLLSLLSQKYKLVIGSVATGYVPLLGNENGFAEGIKQLSANGAESRLGQAIREVLATQRGTSPAALLLLTDGVTTEGESLEDAAQIALHRDVPLYTVALGSEQAAQDIELTDLLVEDTVFVNDLVDFRVKVRASGLAGRQVTLKLMERDQTEVLAKTDVQLKEDGELQTVHLPYRPNKEGEHDYVVSIAPLEEETSPHNNQLSKLVTVRNEQIRVLLVQGYPNYEFRYLKHMLQRDPTIKLQVVLQEADLEYAESDDTALRIVPVKREDLFRYDVIILGDANPAQLTTSTHDHLVEFVEKKGGGLVFIAGPRYVPLAYRNSSLAPLIPLDLATSRQPTEAALAKESFTTTPTEIGLLSPAMQLGDSLEQSRELWQGLPELHWLFEGVPTHSAQVLAEHPLRTLDDGQKAPVILLQFAGAGKVLFHATDETWRWRYRVGDVYFARYWVQQIRYLSRAKLLGQEKAAELTADRREYRRGDMPRLRVRFFDTKQIPANDNGVTLFVERTGDARRELVLHRSSQYPGIFEGTAGDLAEGTYRAWLAEPTSAGRPPATDFKVIAPPGEFARLQADYAALRRAATISRGKFYTLPDTVHLAQDLPSGKQVPFETLPPVILWNQWWVLLTFLLLLVAEWILRKRAAMV